MPWDVLKNAIGLAEGGTLRTALDQVRASIGLPADPAQRSAQSRIGFTIAVVALAAKMSKADGVSSDIEAAAFEQSFAVPESELSSIRRLYAQAAQDIAGYDAYARQIAGLLVDEPELKVAVMECLLHIATADGILHPGEDDFLHTVALILGVSESEFQCLRRAFVSDPDSPYEVLNVSVDASDAEIKRRYRDLVKSHHPDLLISKGVPKEFLVAAERRLMAINTAYEDIVRERGAAVAQVLERSS